MKIDRRYLIKTGLTVGAGAILNPISAQTLFTRKSPKTINIGFVGTGLRGGALIQQLLKLDGVKIPAICDINEENLQKAERYILDAGHEKPDSYSKSETDFKRLCQRSDLDLVITATPWEWHTPVCLAAMEAGINVASEVPIAVTEDECWQLIETSERTGKFCTMLENVSYWKNVMTISKMIHRGIFGEILHAQVGYQHDIRPGRFNDKTLAKYNKTGLAHWRIGHHEKRQGNLYPTHSLGSTALWMDINRGDRFSYLVSMETFSMGLSIYAGREFGELHPLAKKKYKHGDINTTLIKTEKGRTITLYHDVSTYRPYDLVMRVQGTEGIYSSSNGIFIYNKSPVGEQWDDFYAAPYVNENLSKLWKDQENNAAGAGHDGGDYMELYRLVEAVKYGMQPDIDVYDATTWSVVSDLSERSVVGGSQPVQFPDFTKGAWETRSSKNSIFIL
jgi:predicted dehydrogenase